MRGEIQDMARTTWNIEILSPIQEAYKDLATISSLPPWGKVQDYLNSGTPISAKILTTAYLQECCRYGVLYDGRRVDSLIIRPIIANYYFEFKIGERYADEPYKILAVYIKNISKENLILLESLDKVNIKYAVLPPWADKISSRLSGGGG